MLLTRVTVQRLAAVQVVETWRTPLAVLEAALAARRKLRRHPWVLAFAAALLLKAPHHRLALWATRALTVWRLYRTVQAEWPRRQ
ncbi:MAG: hypothetical protein MZU91_01300 [Desulfosudis oleivorans]|nr:hypothetical protein [Desulfosudis oleivorans]